MADDGWNGLPKSNTGLSSRFTIVVAVDVECVFGGVTERPVGCEAEPSTVYEPSCDDAGLDDRTGAGAGAGAAGFTVQSA